MLPLLSLRSLAARRGDGLHPELLALLRSERNGGLSVCIEAESRHPPRDGAGSRDIRSQCQRRGCLKCD